MSLQVVVKRGDLAAEEADALVNPANSHGWMGGGVAYAIKKAGGQIIEDEAVRRGPTPVGGAVATSGGSLRARYVIHAPTMEEPAQRIGVGNVAAATRAALLCAAGLGLRSVAFPGMGTGVGGVSKRDAAAAMVHAIKGVVAAAPSLERIVLVAFDEELKKYFLGCVEDAGL
jgi:O-acetyl-ADP-ribose deacetylase (regulator of RNase III)